MAGYPYSKLNTTPFEIRLLTLKPVDWSAGLGCDLCHTALDSALSYEALSYTWGDASNQREILIDGIRCTITENLEVALRYLRQKDEARTLWADAICINQSDVDERTGQVQRMLDIFKAAARVLAWTGVPSNDSDEALNFLTKFGRVILGLFRDKTRLVPPDYAGGKKCPFSQVFFQSEEPLLSLAGFPVVVIEEVVGPVERVHRTPTNAAETGPSIERAYHQFLQLVPLLSHKD